MKNADPSGRHVVCDWVRYYIFDAEYLHQDQRFTVQIYATDWDDAHARMRSIRTTMVGDPMQLMANIPAWVPLPGLLARAICWWRNLLA